MAEMGRYCKAYPIEMLRRFPRFKIDPGRAREEEDEKTGKKLGPRPIPEDGFLYLQENLVVTDGIYKDEYVVFEDRSPQWASFCKDSLKFEIPDYIRQMEEAERRGLDEFKKEQDGRPGKG